MLNEYQETWVDLDPADLAYVQQVLKDRVTVRGRIAIGEDVRRNHVLRHRTCCRFTELTWDIPEYRIVRQVAHMTADWVERRTLRDELRRIDRMLAEVAPFTLPAGAIDRFAYGRLNDDYRPIHALCRLFLEGSGVSEDAGVFDFRTFLFDMNALFERFVTRLLTDQVSKDLTVESQAKITLGTHNEVTMFPDIVLRRAGRAVMGIDCKYKRLDSGQHKNHDQYQVLAYCTALDVTRGLLVYPRHEQALDQTIRIRNSDVRIRQLSIDLGGDQPAFAASREEFIARVVEWSRPEPSPLARPPGSPFVAISTAK